MSAGLAVRVEKQGMPRSTWGGTRVVLSWAMAGSKLVGPYKSLKGLIRPFRVL